MANDENLRPWPKGVSGNPGGSSQRQRVTAALHRLLDRLDGADDELALVLFSMAAGKLKDPETGKPLGPSLGWFKVLIERLEGRLPEAPKPERETWNDIPETVAGAWDEIDRISQDDHGDGLGPDIEPRRDPPGEEPEETGPFG
jgi:hypothetical protein